MKRLNRNFFTQSTLKVAKDLLGKYLVRKVASSATRRGGEVGQKIFSGKIVETEVYIGPQDRASHGYKMKKTARNKAEYLIGGHIYIYLVYGMYYQLNISTEKEGLPRCVLIRALEPVVTNQHELTTNNTNLSISEICDKLKKIRGDKKFLKIGGKLVKIRDLANGPGKLCRWLKLDQSFYAEDLVKSKRIWLENRGIKIPKNKIVATKRIGIDYAGQYWANRKLRFYIKNNPFVSRYD